MSGLPGEELPGPVEALPLHKEGGTRTPPNTPWHPSSWGGPRSAPSPPRCFLGLVLHLPSPRSTRRCSIVTLRAETRSPRRAPRGCPAPRQPPHDAGSFPPPGRAPISVLALPGFTAVGSGLKVREPVPGEPGRRGWVFCAGSPPPRSASPSGVSVVSSPPPPVDPVPHGIRGYPGGSRLACRIAGHVGRVGEVVSVLLAPLNLQFPQREKSWGGKAGGGGRASRAWRGWGLRGGQK